MLNSSCLDPPSSGKAGGAFASRLDPAPRVKAALRAAVAIGIIGLTTGCQSQSQGQSATVPPSLDVSNGLAVALKANQDTIPPLFFVEASAADEPPSVSEALVTPAVPGPLPIFGAAAAFGASRQLRKRIKVRASKPSKPPMN
jgi:hypothetical protein